MIEDGKIVEASDQNWNHVPIKKKLNWSLVLLILIIVFSLVILGIILISNLIIETLLSLILFAFNMLVW